MLMTNFSFEVEQVRGVLVLRFTVEALIEDNFAGISDELHTLIHDLRPRRVVVDLGNVEEVDDLGLAMLQSFHDGIEELGGTAILCRMTSSVSRAMAESGLHHMLHIRSSFNEAIWTF